jgi:hypothetical protein
VGLAVLAAVAVWLRWVGLSRDSLWFDEGMTWWLSSLSPGELLRVIRGDVACPLHYLLLHGWRVLCGDSDAAMRAMSASAATLALLPFYLIVRRVIQNTAGRLVACGLMAVSFMQIQYAHEARYYALLSLVTMSALACVPVLANRRSWPVMIGFVIACAAGMYTHNIMMFYVLGLYAAWLIWPGERRVRLRLGDMAIAGVLLLLVYVPWAPVLMQQMRWMTGTFWARQPGAFDLGLVLSAITGVDVWNTPGGVWRAVGWLPHIYLVASVTVLCLAAAIMLARSSAALALAAFALGPIAIVFCYSQFRQPIFFERVFIASSCVAPILLGMAVERVRAAWAVTAVVAAMTLISTGRLLTENRKEDWSGAYQYVAHLSPSDRRLIVLVANEGEMPFWYYAAHDPSRKPEPRTGVPQGFFDLDPPKTIERVKTDADLTRLRQAMGQWDEIVLILSHTDFADPGGLTEAELRAKWKLADEKELRLVRVLRFAAP